MSSRGAFEENMLNAMRSRGAAMPREGWVCPKCGRVYSPTWFECQSCNKAVTASTAGNGTET